MLLEFLQVRSNNAAITAGNLQIFRTTSGDFQRLDGLEDEVRIGHHVDQKRVFENEICLQVMDFCTLLRLVFARLVSSGTITQDNSIVNDEKRMEIPTQTLRSVGKQ